MTACTNHGGKARRVVTAALVGVLSVGTVPMVALATGADTADGIQTLVADWSTDAKVTAPEDGKGSVFTGDLTKPVSFDLGSGKYLVPTEITNQNGDVTDVIDAELSLTYEMPAPSATYDANGVWQGLYNNFGGAYRIDGDATKTESPVVVSDAGTDGARVQVSAEFAASYFAGTLTDGEGRAVKPVAGSYGVYASDVSASALVATFSVVASDPFAGAYAYIGDTSHKDIVYTGSSLKVAVGFSKANGDALVWGTDFDGISYYTASGELVTDFTNAGDYTAVLTLGGDELTRIDFTVQKFDVSKHADAIDDFINNEGDWTLSFDQNAGQDFLNSWLGTTLGSKFEVVSATSPDGTRGFSQSKGLYTVTVRAKSDADVTGETTVTFSNLDDEVYDDGDVDLYYGAQDTFTDHTVSINLTEGESFDASKIRVRAADGTPSWSGDALEVTYKLGAKTVDASELSKAGNYVVTVRVKPFQDENGQWLGGTRSFDVSVKGNEAYGSNVSFYLDGEVAGTSASLEYDGTDLLSRVSARVTNPEGGSFEYGTDFDFKVTKGGEEVDSIVDAGEYNIKVNPLTFEFATTTEDVDLDLTVTPQVVNNLKGYGYNGEQGYFPANKNNLPAIFDGSYPSAAYVNDAVAWTGSAVEVPGVQYLDDDADAYVTLDPSLYNVVSIKKGDRVVKEAVDEGWYTARIALSDEAKANYSLQEREFTFQVVKYNPFDDVESPAWYASAVADAKFNNIVNGMSGTNMYAPEAKISRADAVGILFNLAGGSALLDDNMYTENGGWLTGFDDVDGNAYYAGALAWAHKAGVVNGHGGNFRPNDSITREELATMLANYAKATGDFVASDGSALAAIADGSDVSAWAQESVAWAVENEIMGNGGFVAAHTDITRAEVAAMAVNYADKF